MADQKPDPRKMAPPSGGVIKPQLPRAEGDPVQMMTTSSPAAPPSPAAVPSESSPAPAKAGPKPMAPKPMAPAGETGAAPPKPVAPKPVAATPAAGPTPVAPKPAVAAATATATATAPPPKPPAPKPAAAPKPKPKVQTVWEPTRKELTRRGFLSTIGLAWGSFVAASAASLLVTQRFMFPNIPIYNPPMQFKAGLPGTYEIGKVDERWKQRFGTWIVRTAEGFYALSTKCTHLGCTPNWLETEDKFKCPCHGSGFRKSGINFEGPAPRPLERFRIALAEDGQILVDKSRLFQQEKGDWEKPDCFLSWT